MALRLELGSGSPSGSPSGWRWGSGASGNGLAAPSVAQLELSSVAQFEPPTVNRLGSPLLETE